MKICKRISESLYFIAEVDPAAVKVCDNVFDLDNKETNKHDLFKTIQNKTMYVSKGHGCPRPVP